MPIKLQWTRGKNLGLALIFLGVMGFVQVIFVTIAQYAMEVGALYYTFLIPIGVTLALFYSTIVIFESSTSMQKYRSSRTYTKKKKSTSKMDIQAMVDKIPIDKAYLRPVLIVIIGFSILFGITYLITKDSIDEMSTVFIVCENVGAIGSLLLATYVEMENSRKAR